MSNEKYRKKYSERWEKDRKSKVIFTHRYNAIPNGLLESPIIEIGPGEGLRQVQCKHKEFFLNADYLGVDLLKPKNPALHIIQGNIADYPVLKQYKTVLLIGVLEHIPLASWPFVVWKLKSLCMTRGKVILFVPHKESIDNYMIDKGDHLVYGITKKFMNHFFPGADIKNIYDQRVRYKERFAYFKAAGRFIKSLVTLDKRALKLIPQRIGIMVVWRKK